MTLQDVGDVLEYRIADGVAEGVVDALEAVEIGEDHGARGSVAAGQRDLAGQLLVEAPAPREAGELISLGDRLGVQRQPALFLDRLLEFLAGLRRNDVQLQAQERSGDEQPGTDGLRCVEDEFVRLGRLRRPIADGVQQDVQVRHAAPDEEGDRGAADDEHHAFRGDRHPDPWSDERRDREVAEGDGSRQDGHQDRSHIRSIVLGSRDLERTLRKRCANRHACRVWRPERS